MTFGHFQNSQCTSIGDLIEDGIGAFEVLLWVLKYIFQMSKVPAGSSSFALKVYDQLIKNTQ